MLSFFFSNLPQGLPKSLPPTLDHLAFEYDHAKFKAEEEERGKIHQQLPKAVREAGDQGKEHFSVRVDTERYKVCSGQIYQIAKELNAGSDSRTITVTEVEDYTDKYNYAPHVTAWVKLQKKTQ